MNSILGVLRDKAIYRIAFALVVPVLLLIVGFGTGVGVAELLAHIDIRPVSSRLPQAPSEPVELIAASSGCLAINAVDGNSYVYCDNYSSDSKAWSSEYEPARWSVSHCPDDAFSDPPKGTIQVIEYCHGFEFADYTRFVLFQDRTIRMYRVQTASAMGAFGRGIAAILICSIIGLVLGIGIVFKVLMKKDETAGTN